MRIRTRTHTSHLLLLSSHLSESCLRELGVEVLRRGAGNGALLQLVHVQESEEESGEVPGLSAPFSA